MPRRRPLIDPDEYGHRPVNNWGDGDLPAPYAIGDQVEFRNPPPPGGYDRLDDIGDGPFVVVTAFSIDEGDAWYFRVGNTATGDISGRLHVANAERSTIDEDWDWMAPLRLTKTVDPDGLALREQMLTDWTFTSPYNICPTCGNVTRKETDDG